MSATRLAQGKLNLGSYKIFIWVYVNLQSYPSQGGQNGSNYFKIDAKTFAEWGVDSFKFDGCHTGDKHQFDKLFPEMGKALNESGNILKFTCKLLIIFH